MIEKTEVKKLFQKFIDNTLSKAEYDTFIDLINSEKHKGYFEELMTRHWTTIENAKKLPQHNDPEISNHRFQDILNQVEDNYYNMKSVSTKKRNILFLSKIAASVLILAGLFMFFESNNKRSITKTMDTNNKPVQNEITLKLANGNIKVISQNEEHNIIDAQGNVVGTQKGAQLNYSIKTVPKKLVYNELSIPYGKQFSLALSDGTKINLNAGSWIKYPVQFIKGEKRKVYLKGEAYFDVAKDELHPFIVNANDINVTVLGTEFNMSYYPEDSEITTVLVEGSVRLHQGGQEDNTAFYTFLKPGHKAAWNKNKKNMHVEEVDVALYTAWKSGELLFKKTPFRNIIKRLERHFDVVIEDQHNLLNSQVYSASFRNESIEEILEAFQEDTPFYFAREKNKIVITNMTD